MITSFKRLIAATAFILPVAALVASPVLAATPAKTKTAHHTAVHKVSVHKSHSKKVAAPTAS